MKEDRRSTQDRRSGKDRRRFTSLKRILSKPRDRQEIQERRQAPERRWGWVRFSKWSSVHLSSLKIAKYLRTGEPNRDSRP